MTANTKWVGGAVGLTYASAGFTAANFNSLASGSCVVASTATANQTNLDLWYQVSFALTVGGTTTAISYLALYWLPLNQDGTTYGDGTTSGTVAPAQTYWVGNATVRSGLTSGSVVTGTFPAITVPPTAGVWVIVNNLGVALSATAAASVQMIDFNVNLNG